MNNFKTGLEASSFHLTSSVVLKRVFQGSEGWLFNLLGVRK